MGRIIQYNNGKTTILTTGESISGLTPETNTYYVGVDNNSGTYEKLNPDGSVIDLETSPQFQYEIGEYVPSEGGVIFHRYEDGGVKNYLVVDITNLSTSSSWSNVTGTLIGSSAKSTWDGYSNTNAIITQSGATTGAAFLCNSSTNGGKNDWYLPAIDELNLLWQNRFNINRTLSGNSSAGVILGATQLLYETYWSSEERNSNTAWSLYFEDGAANYYFQKNYLNYVRAVRKF